MPYHSPNRRNPSMSRDERDLILESCILCFKSISEKKDDLEEGGSLMEEGEQRTGGVREVVDKLAAEGEMMTADEGIVREGVTWQEVMDTNVEVTEVPINIIYY